MRGVDADGRAVEHGPDDAAGKPLEALTVAELRAVVVAMLRAGGAATESIAGAMNCSRASVFRYARTPVPDLADPGD